MSEINVVSVLLVTIFLLPILIGAFEPLTREKFQYSFTSLFDNIEFLFGLLLSIYLTKNIFFEHSNDGFRKIYESIPEGIRAELYGKDILTYMVVVPILLLFLLLFVRLITTPIYNVTILPLSNGLYTLINSSSIYVRRMFGALWKVPKAIFMVLIFGLLINFYTYYFSTPQLSKWLNESGPYQVLYQNAVYPVLNSNVAKKIPVLVNDSFRKTMESVVPIDSELNGASLARQLARQLPKGNIKVIEYFNGVTLDEAIKSTPEIDEAAKKIVGDEKDSKKKALLLYKWITKNVKYDYDKAVKVSTNPSGISSGSIVAFNTRKGICFDYSCLYISMCRAVGIKVRLITGLGYSGVSWGDHAWNQVYSSEENRWINVDTTFGTASNYFDKRDFGVDHRYDEIQGEW